jgi:hypothetical protein
MCVTTAHAARTLVGDRQRLHARDFPRRHGRMAERGIPERLTEAHVKALHEHARRARERAQEQCDYARALLSQLQDRPDPPQTPAPPKPDDEP